MVARQLLALCSIALATGLAAPVCVRAADDAAAPHEPAGSAPPSATAQKIVAAGHGGMTRAPGAAEAQPGGPHAAAEHGSGGGHEAHDPHDLSHANAGAALGNPIEWRYDLSLATFAVFVVLLLLLGRFAWKPIMTGLDRREATVAARIEAAERSAEEAAEQLRQYQAKLTQATAEALQIVARAHKEAETAAAKIVAAAEHEARLEGARAIADIAAAKHAALREVAQRGTELSILLASRILGRELQAADHSRLIAEALERLPSSN